MTMPSAETAMGRKKILVVDDEQSILLGMKRYFRSRGYEVDCASEKAEAMALLASASYACVIADLCLTEGQGTDGLDIVAHAGVRQPQTPVVVLTAYGCPAAEAEAARLGAGAFLSKPQSMERLAEVVGGLLESEPGDPGAPRVVERSPKAEGNKAARKMKILVVDDSKTALFVQSMILKKGHYELVTADDGEEAVRKALAELPDLILMDVVMPKMTGFEACRELRKREATKAIPIILVTTRGEATNVEQGFESGCTDYVTKPIDGLVLLSKVRDCLSN
jgi:CheY-like chemotaxis protein